MLNKFGPNFSKQLPDISSNIRDISSQSFGGVLLSNVELVHEKNTLSRFGLK